MRRFCFCLGCEILDVMNMNNSSWLEGGGPVGSVGSMGPSTALRSSSALKRVPRAGRTGCSRRVPRAGRALCRGTRSSAKRVPVCGPAAQNQDLRGTGCWPVTTATMGGEVRLPRFVPLWPALPHRVFFFGEGKGCPTLRGVCTQAMGKFYTADEDKMNRDVKVNGSKASPTVSSDGWKLASGGVGILVCGGFAALTL
ncbi:MAG: hypothetical protein JWR26_1381 [Pedosphaera sp.]|nr:hypothetical protein [Pedosphaera sp.]